MNERYRYLSKNFILFTISSFAPKLLVFLLVPLYTRCLSTAEYGTADIISTTAQLLVPILVLSIDTAVMRFSIDPSYRPETILTNGMYVLLRGTLLCAVSLAAVYILPFTHFEIIYVFSVLMMFLSNSLYNILVNFLRGIDRIGLIVEASLINTAMTCGLNIWLLVYCHAGLEGYLLASYGGTYIAILWLCLRLKLHRYLKPTAFNRPILREMQRFSIPLIFNKIGWWVNGVADRYMVTWIDGVAANGIYTVAYKIPTILTTCGDIFAQAWQLSAIREMDTEDGGRFVRRMYELYSVLLMLCCSVLLILNIPLAKILYGYKFFEAWKYVPPLLISGVFGGLSGFIGSIFMAAKDTKIFSQSTMIGAAVNIVLNLILIYLIGPMGAAIATLVSNVVIWAVRSIAVRKYVRVSDDIKREFAGYLLLIIQMGVCEFGFTLITVAAQLVLLCGIILLYHAKMHQLMTTMKQIVSKIRR